MILCQIIVDILYLYVYILKIVWDSAKRYKIIDAKNAITIYQNDFSFRMKSNCLQKRINAIQMICLLWFCVAIKTRSIIDYVDFNCVTFDFREQSFLTVDWCRSESHQSWANTHTHTARRTLIHRAFTKSNVDWLMSWSE